MAADPEAILRLARTETAEALAQLRQYPVETLAAALQQLSPDQRLEFLESAERVDEIVPLLPEAEFTRTVRSTGIEESGWLVEFASPEQRVAAVDLDCWRGARLSPGRLFEWIDAMIEAGPETLAAAVGELDPELWVLAMKSMGRFSIAGFGEEESCEGMTEDGVVFYVAHTGESEERIREILSTALVYAPSHYFRLVYGSICESAAESEAFAARWQQNRLADLGFPDREQAMRAYRPLAVGEARAIDADPAGSAGEELGLAPTDLAASLVGRALADLPPARADEVFGHVLAVANALAVADQLPLTETKTAERCLAKALRGIDRGLIEAARAENLPLHAVLDATPPLDLFRIGATLDPGLRPRKAFQDLLEEEGGADWDREAEMISEHDQTLGRDGRPV